jgi:hypothetical protein
MPSHSCPIIGIHIQDMVFLLESGKRNPPTICHNHARACIWIWRALACGGGRWPKCWTNQDDFTQVVFLSFTPSRGSSGRTPSNASTMFLHPCGFMWLVTAYPLTRRPNSMATSSSVIVISPQEGGSYVSWASIGPLALSKQHYPSLGALSWSMWEAGGNPIDEGKVCIYHPIVEECECGVVKASKPANKYQCWQHMISIWQSNFNPSITKLTSDFNPTSKRSSSFLPWWLSS